MTAKKYKVLWIDDQHEGMQDFKDLAINNEIIFDCYKSYEAGFADFENRLFDYDAILLDAIFLQKDAHVAGSEDLKGLSAATSKIDEFKKQRPIPFFILSGQTRLDNNSTFFDTYGTHYRKQSIDDIQRLLKDIKIHADLESYTKVKHKYQNLFDVCTDKYIGEKASVDLLDILHQMEYGRGKFDDVKYFNALRKIVEYVFRASNKIGFLHDKCISNGIVNLTWSSMFLAGKEVILRPSTDKINCTKTYFSNILEKNVRALIDITNAASHTEGNEKENAKIKFSEYKKQITSNYLLYSLTFQVIDLVLWFKKCADENPDYEANITHWKP